MDFHSDTSTAWVRLTTKELSNVGLSENNINTLACQGDDPS